MPLLVATNSDATSTMNETASAMRSPAKIVGSAPKNTMRVNITVWLAPSFFAIVPVDRPDVGGPAIGGDDDGEEHRDGDERDLRGVAEAEGEQKERHQRESSGSETARR